MPQHYPGYNAVTHPGYDDIKDINKTKFRLVRQIQTRPIWSISTPKKFLGEIEWVKDFGFRVRSVLRQPRVESTYFEFYGDAVLCLHQLVHLEGAQSALS